MLFAGKIPEKIYEDPLKSVTDDQKKIMEEVKAKILHMDEAKDELISKWLTEMVYFRFCSGWDWDVEKSFAALSKTVIWRKEYRPELIKLSDLDFMKDITQPVFYHKGYDKEGHPVVYIHLANTDLIQNDKEGEKKFKLVVYVMEQVYQKAFPQGRYKCTLVVDVTKIGLTWVGVIKRFGSVFTRFGDYYCETLNKAFCVNAGIVIRGIYNVAATFMHKKTKEKFSVEGNCKKLKEYIDEKTIPKYFEGSDDWEYKYLEHLDFLKKQEEESKEE